MIYGLTTRGAVIQVTLETAGTVDLDVELKFFLGEENFSIDVKKSELEGLTQFYKALVKLASEQKENKTHYQFSERALNTAFSTLAHSRPVDDLAGTAEKLTVMIDKHLNSTHERFGVKNYEHVFKLYNLI